MFHVEQLKAEFGMRGVIGLKAEKRDCFASLAMTLFGLFTTAATLVRVR